MILFIGDSFTWGQGLQYYYLTEHKGWNWEDCDKFVSNNERFEFLGFEEDEFRRTNSFPYLVSKQLDSPYQTPRFENGGDNWVTYNILENIQNFCSTTNITLVVIQFSSPSRSILNGSEPKFNTIEQNIEYQIKRIDSILEIHNISWLGISWQEEIGDLLKEKYPKNHIPIKYKNSKYNSFDKHELNNLFINSEGLVNDGHFNLLGHKIIADSILDKINSERILVSKFEDKKRHIHDFIFGG